MLRLLMTLNDHLHVRTKTLMNDCIVFVCEFIDLDFCLVGPRRYHNRGFVCFYVLLQTISQMVDPTTLKKLID